jgi:3-deoxy-D-manno-octulosonate 8-phosphate phosphatase (KDO 8-P phosphatase)
MMNFKEHLNKITTFMFDIDGVITNGQVLVMENGEIVRNMNGKDTYAMHMAIFKGYRIAIISGGNNIAVKTALLRTGVKDVFINQKNKLDCYRNYVRLNNLTDEEIVYMGDDLPDLDVMSAAGLAVCPNDAVPEIRDICKYVSGKKGGEGCVRDIIEQVLKVQGNWEAIPW